MSKTQTRLEAKFYSPKGGRKMPYERTRITQRFEGDRAALRRSLIEAFLAEEPGTGKQDKTTRYTYVADTSPSGHDIELHRPALLNNGFDFTVRIPSLKLSELRAPWCSVPRHEDLKEILHQLLSQDVAKYALLQDAIIAAWRCETIDEQFGELQTLIAAPVAEGLSECPADVVALMAKWLFAEQDVTYWNQSGRRMLMQKLVEEGLMPEDALHPLA